MTNENRKGALKELLDWVNQRCDKFEKIQSLLDILFESDNEDALAEWIKETKYPNNIFSFLVINYESC